MTLNALIALLVACQVGKTTVVGFTVPTVSCPQRSRCAVAYNPAGFHRTIDRKQVFSKSNNPEEESSFGVDDPTNDDSHLFRQVLEEENESSSSSTTTTEAMMDELSWRTHKVRLEEQNEKRFRKALKSKPRKLPYADAKKWVQANLGAETQDEFEDLVMNGNLRTPYIPKDPARYYTDEGTWQGWDDFLKGSSKSD